MSKWVPVEDQLPGEQVFDSAEVLVFLMGHCEITDMECRKGHGWGIRLGYYDADIGCFRVHGRPNHSVTHWQALPEKPERTAPPTE